MTTELTKEELIFLQACFNDSCSEGMFDELFETIDQSACEKSLIEKGVLKPWR